MKNIKLFATDVDGTLTDGHIYISKDGEIFKAFDSKDGYGIKHLKKTFGIPTAIITGRESKIVEMRARELGIDYVFQNVSDKIEVIEALKQNLNITNEEIAYIGDDLNDLPILELVGYSGCPANSVKEVIEQCDYVCKRNGGDGAVRDFIDHLIEEYK